MTYSHEGDRRTRTVPASTREPGQEVVTLECEGPFPAEQGREHYIEIRRKEDAGITGMAYMAMALTAFLVPGETGALGAAGLNKMVFCSSMGTCRDSYRRSGGSPEAFSAVKRFRSKLQLWRA
jgi:hypothetical protein